METLTDLKNRFEAFKKVLTDEWGDIGDKNDTPPTDLEVWGQMRANNLRKLDEAIADDMQGYEIIYQKRIELIEQEMKKIMQI